MRIGPFLLGTLLACSALAAEGSTPAGQVHGRKAKKKSRKSGRKAAPRSAEQIRKDDELERALGGGGPVLASADPSAPDQLTNQQINETVISHKAEILECVKRQRSEQSGQSGTLVMSWVIDPGGGTSAVAAATPEFESAPLASCLSELIKGWSFPRHRLAQDAISFPFKF